MSHRRSVPTGKPCGADTAGTLPSASCNSPIDEREDERAPDLPMPSKSGLIRRARRTLPNIFSPMRRQSSRKTQQKDRAEVSQGAAKRKVTSCEETECNRQSEVTVATTQPSLDKWETTHNKALIGAESSLTVDTAVGDRKQAETSKVGSAIDFSSENKTAIMNRVRKASFLLLLPTAENSPQKDSVTSLEASKARRATSFSCAENREMFDDVANRKKRWSFLNRLFSDKRKIKRSVSAKSKARLASVATANLFIFICRRFMSTSNKCEFEAD